MNTTVIYSKYDNNSKFWSNNSGATSVIEWYEDTESRQQYLIAGGSQPSAFPYLWYMGKGMRIDISKDLQWHIDEMEGKHLTVAQRAEKLDIIGVYTIRTACRNLGVEDKLDYMILKTPNWETDWIEANAISLNSEEIQMLFNSFGLNLDDICLEIIGIYDTFGDEKGGTLVNSDDVNDVCDYIIRVNSNLGTSISRTEIHDALDGKERRQEFFIADSNNHVFRVFYDYEFDKYFWSRYKVV